MCKIDCLIHSIHIQYANSYPEQAGIRTNSRETIKVQILIEFVDCCLYFFLLAIVLSVLLRFMDSEYSFGISKLFLLISKSGICLKHDNKSHEFDLSLHDHVTS